MTLEEAQTAKLAHIAAKLALVWFLAVFAAGAAAQLVARAALRAGDEP